MNKGWFLGIVGLVVLLAGGQLADRQWTHRPEAVLTRATAYWEAVRLRDYLTQYQMDTKTALGLMKPHEFTKRKPFGAHLVRYDLGQVKVMDDLAEIDIEIENSLMEMNGKTLPAQKVKDVWRFINGQWFHGDIPRPNPGKKGAAIPPGANGLPSSLPKEPMTLPSGTPLPKPTQP